ncbi:MAG: gamma-glutamyltransferase [Gammaproteobacteria bacterium]|nr:MAG: gamma-glutamyltransferase [Gammaproteobacteria bacterium]RTZ75190.1 MAG: gamma-glutamyltransferase [Gammaproteobacteria bacterium]
MTVLSWKAPSWSFLAFWLLWSLASARTPPAAAVASAHPAATEAGMEILRAGGNAFDAAVAVSAALAVVEPYSSGLGGGGFWLLHRASDGRQVMIDGRERAPLAAQREMYLDEKGEVVPGLSIDGPLAAGIPGEPAALAHIARRYGRLPLARSLAPAIRLAREGFEVDAHYRRMARFRLGVLRRHASTRGIFLKEGEVPPLGWRIRQPGLARTLEQLAEKGREGFYAGPVARKLVNSVRRHGGIWTLEDLKAYRVVEREPIVGRYRGYRVVTAAPPSSGGVVLVEMLNMLAQKQLARLSEADHIHFMIEVMRRAYFDRARYLGDPDQVEMPLQKLLSEEHARRWVAGIHMDRATSSAALDFPKREGQDTTHFSIIDREGNRVAATLSINYPFGSGFVAEGTGVLLNDEMDDFSAKPGAANVYGLVGNEANAIAPGRRMLSSMTPTFVEHPEGVAILGTPGGSRIITMVLLGLLEFIEGHGPSDWVSRKRFHHQYLPDQVQFEPGAFSSRVRRRLEEKGHVLKPLERPYGNMQAVFWDRKGNRVEAASDPRGIGLASVLPENIQPR